MHVADNTERTSRTRDLLMAGTMAAVLVVPFYSVANAGSESSADPAAAEETENGQAASETGATESEGAGEGTMDGETAGAEGEASTAGEDDAATTAGAAGGQFLEGAEGDALHGEDLIGKQVVSSDGESIGTVKDILLEKDGSMRGVLLSSGGFLGIGEKQVGVRWDETSMSVTAEALETGLSQEDIKNAPEYQAAAAGEGAGAGDEGAGEGEATGETGATGEGEGTTEGVE